MPVRIPTATVRNKKYRRAKQWMAKRKRQGYCYYLGYFATKKEAEDIERSFDAEWPRGT